MLSRIIQTALLSCFILTLSEGQHFNFSPSELKERCERKENSLLFKDIEEYQRKIGSLKAEIGTKVFRGGLKEQEKKLDDLCYSNSNLTILIEKLYESVQLCLDEEENFNQQDGERIVMKMLHMICATTKYSVFTDNEKNCMDSLPDCSDPFDTPWSLIYYLVPLPLIRTADECLKLHKYFRCKEDHMNRQMACSPTTRIKHNEISEDVMSFFICQK